jgi:hypothetical protein
MAIPFCACEHRARQLKGDINLKGGGVRHVADKPMGGSASL